MNPTGAVWMDFFGRLAIESSALMALAAVISRTLSVQQQRKIWQVALSALLVLFLVEATGVHRRVQVSPGHPRQAPPTRSLVVEVKAGEEATRAEMVTARLLTEASFAGWLPGIVWLAVFGWIAARSFGSRMIFLAWRDGRRVLAHGAWQEKLAGLACQMNTGQVRLSQSRLLAGPIAFGFFRRCICVPEHFGRDFKECEQEVMLAHEVAHLAVRDPLWYAIVDLVAALFWFNPLVWFGRRQFQTACECAADEASLMLPEGPSTLAACLVQFGKRLAVAKSYGWIGIEGNRFHSALGRRVNRLLTMQGKRWRALPRWWTGTVYGTGMLCLGALLVASAATGRGWSHSLGQHLWTLAFSTAAQPAPAIPEALNTPPTQVMIEAKFLEFSDPLNALDVLTHALSGHKEGPNAPSFSGVLPPSRYRALIKQLEEQAGVDLLSAPKVTTLSGRQAQIKIVEVRYIVTHLDHAEAAANAPLPIAEPFELGPTLDVKPTVLADGMTIQLTLISTIREFIGYDSPQQAVPLPTFRLRQAQTSLSLWDGQTAMIALEVKNPASPNPNLKYASSGKVCFVFVTATLIDPAGNRLNQEADLPFAEHGVPK